METQKDKVRKHLKAGYTITPLEALQKFSSFRLSAIIWDLREEGMTILTEMVDGPENKFARYKLVTEEEVVA
jgi:hypothetical protein